MADTQMKKTCKEALDTFGIKNQVGMMFEEFGETIAKLHQYFYRNRGNLTDLCLEVADASIMLKQLEIHIHEVGGKDNLDEAIDFKLERLRGKIAKHVENTDNYERHTSKNYHETCNDCFYVRNGGVGMSGTICSKYSVGLVQSELSNAVARCSQCNGYF